MKILHLTDLHLTDASREELGSLLNVWNDAKGALPQRLASFDFVAITGDLTQSATEGEYKELGAFLKLLVKRVRDRDPRRIIMIPGNHDVDWSVDCGPAIDAAALRSDEALRTRFAKALRNVAASDLRWKLTPSGELLLHEIAEKSYAQRFQWCQHFLSSFYADHTPDADRRFRLTEADPKQHWSAHRFEEERILFLGFNSCHRNDSMWRGAKIAMDALEQAKEYANEHAPVDEGWTRIVLWHHGIRSDHGDPDLLTARNLASIAMLQPALGMHGHTHRDGITELRESVQTPFPVVGAGSFIVSADQRAEGVPNGFSVIELTRSLIRWERYRRDPSGPWQAPAARDEVIFSRLPKLDRQAPSTKVLPRVGLHRRSARVSADGIATVSVSLRDAHLEGDLPLAHIHTPFDNYDFEPTAQLGKERRKVVGEEADSGAVWLHLASAEALETKEAFHPSIDWKYRIANSFAISRRDLAASNRCTDNPLSDYDYFAHFVRFQTGELTLELHLPAKSIKHVEARAEERLTGDAVSWRHDKAESSAIEVRHLDQNTDRVSITIKHPILHYRYLLLYKLVSSERDRAIRSDTQAILSEVRARCRSRMNGRQTRRPFAAMTRNAIYESLAAGPYTEDNQVSWVAYLWDEDEKQLLPTFGDGPLEQWSGRFAYGQGLVGHSFRCHGPALYFQRENASCPRDERALLMIERARAKKLGLWLHDHEWIVCVPIIELRDGTAVGVVSFSSIKGESSSPASAALRKIASTAVAGTRHKVSDQVKALIREISVAFWATVQRLEIGEGESLALPEAEGQGPRIRTNVRTPSEGVVTLRCDHGEVTMQCKDASQNGLGVTGNPCDCALTNKILDLEMDGLHHAATVRRRERDGTLGLSLAPSAERWAASPSRVRA